MLLDAETGGVKLRVDEPAAARFSLKPIKKYNPGRQAEHVLQRLNKATRDLKK